MGIESFFFFFNPFPISFPVVLLLGCLYWKSILINQCWQELFLLSYAAPPAETGREAGSGRGESGGQNKPRFQ